MKVKNQLRHGENIFLKIDKIPHGAKLIDKGGSVIVAHSESGHSHILTIPNLKDAVIKMFEFEGVTYLDVPLKAKLEHQKTLEKHETQTMKPGIYRKLVDQEFDYGLKVLRRVID